MAKITINQRTIGIDLDYLFSRVKNIPTYFEEGLKSLDVLVRLQSYKYDIYCEDYHSTSSIFCYEIRDNDLKSGNFIALHVNYDSDLNLNCISLHQYKCFNQIIAYECKNNYEGIINELKNSLT